MKTRLPKASNLRRLCGVLLAVLLGLVVSQAGFARAQAAGTIASLELQYAPFLAAGGSVTDICDTDDSGMSHSAICDICCLQLNTLAALPVAASAVWPVHPRAAAPLPAADTIVRPRAPPAPPARGPPHNVI